MTAQFNPQNALRESPVSMVDIAKICSFCELLTNTSPNDLKFTIQESFLSGYEKQFSSKEFQLKLCGPHPTNYTLDLVWNTKERSAVIFSILIINEPVPA